MTDSTANSRPVLILQHDPSGRPAYLKTMARERSHAVHTRYVPDGGTWPDVSNYAFVIVMGSPEAAYDDDLPWIADELRFLERAIEADTPMIGICFGGQVLARALGANVKPATRSEVGWHRVESVARDWVRSGIWFGWHSDTFEVPSGAELLAQSDIAPQAFASGPLLGVQFHPEVTYENLELWLGKWAGNELKNHGLTRRDLLEQTEHNLDISHINARHLFDSWYSEHVIKRERDRGSDGRERSDPPARQNTRNQ